MQAGLAAKASTLNIPGGFFITLEGIEGCGKSTQSGLLADTLAELGYQVTRTREPGGTGIGKRIRAVLLDPDSKGITGMTELMLYSADRAQHVTEIIVPALASGGVVVCDRFYDATVAYQGYGRELDMGVIRSLTEMATGGRKPDLTLLLDLPVSDGLTRAISRNDANGAHKEARFEQEEVAFHERVRSGYIDILMKERGRVRLVDATGTIEEIHDAIVKVVADSLALKAGQV